MQKSLLNRNKITTFAHQNVRIMKKILLIILCITCWMTAIPVYAIPDQDGIEQVMRVRITVNGPSVRIVGGDGMVLEVYNLTGAKVLSRQIDGQDKTLSLNLSKGCYLLKVGTVVRKISIQ